MGYTSYWYRVKKDHPQEKWAKFVEDCTKVREALPDTVRLDDVGNDAETFDQHKIRFNGVGDEGHETFMLARTLVKLNEHRPYAFDFCKTARKPYDLMVCVCLILYKYHFRKEVWISSDGTIDDWREAFALIATALPNGKEIGTDFLIADELFAEVPREPDVDLMPQNK